MPAKPTRPEPSKREAILAAMLNVVVERGFHDAPMSLIAERAKVSAGLIYHHFPSKKAIIHALYERVVALKMESFLEGFSPDMEPKASFVQGWHNLYSFYRRHPKEMRFLEQYENAGFASLPTHGTTSPDERISAFMRRFTNRSKGGVLNEWPLEVLQEMTIGLEARLAKLPRKLSTVLLREIAESMWEAIRAK